MGISTWVAVISAVVAVGSLAWNVRHGRLTLRPKVSIDADRMPVGAISWPSRDQGQFAIDGPKASVDFVACTLAVAGSTVITRAGLIPAGAVGRWQKITRQRVDLTGEEYIADADAPDSGRREKGMGLAQIPDEHDSLRLPRQVSDQKLVLRLDVNQGLATIRPKSLVRVWIETSTGHRFYSAPTTAWEQRYRGIAHWKDGELIHGPPPPTSDDSHSELGYDHP